jgi:hypothetical protein
MPVSSEISVLASSIGSAARKGQRPTTVVAFDDLLLWHIERQAVPFTDERLSQSSHGRQQSYCLRY